MKLLTRRLSFVTVLLLLAIGVAAARADDGRNEKRFLARSRQLIYDGARSGEGYFSPDGRYLLFQSEREEGNPFFQIYILDLETGESHRVSPGTGKTTCSFFRPGHDEVLFASTHLDPDAVKKQKEEIAQRASGQKRRYSWDYDPTMDIFSAQRDGSGLARLTDARGYDAEGAYSPDGERIVFCSLRSGYGEGMSEEDLERRDVDASYFGEIYIMNADGSDQTRLTDWPGYDGGPFFTPDGERIVWRHFTEDGLLSDVYTMKTDGTDRRRITDFGAMSWAPYFHSSGVYVIFASNKLGFSNFELYMTDALGMKEPVRVTWTDKFDGLPVFSPDGKRLAWTTSRAAEGKTQIFIADWNHEAALDAIRKAPRREGAEAAPEIPDGGRGTYAMKKDAAARPVAVRIGGGRFDERVAADDLKRQVAYIASDEREGRFTGTKGARAAAAYVAGYFRENGIAPAGDEGNYFQNFPFTSGVEIVPDETALMVTGLGGEEPEMMEPGTDFRPLPFSTRGGADGGLVFAGYGIALPGGDGEPYDSYAGLDVSGKIVVVLRYLPESVSLERRRQLYLGAGIRTKALAAAERGAVAMLVATGPESRGAGELIPFDFDRDYSDVGIPVATISGDLAARLVGAAGKDLDKVQIDLDQENPHAATAFEMEGVDARLYTGVERVAGESRNVLGILPASSSEPIDEYIVLGAHYDHIGHGEIGSFARPGEEGQVHNGADDNASGVAAVMEIAGALAADRAKNPESFRRSILFCLWSGEEIGLVGSTHFLEHPPVPAEKIAAYVNFDMVGRLRDNRLIVQGVGSSDAWPAMLEKKNVSAGFQLEIQRQPMLYTDVTPFYRKGVPVLSFFTGVHEEYNRPADKPSTLDYDGLERIALFAKRIAVDLAGGARPDFKEVVAEAAREPGASSNRPYLGTIPDYVGGDDKGVKLSGVKEGGPAEKGGLRGGDVIVRFGGSEIGNIREYASMLDVVKIGEPVEVTVVRDGEEKTFTVVPEARR